MRFVSLAVMFGGFKKMIERNERNNSELFGTCSDPCERNERNTPLGGVTVVRRVDYGRPSLWALPTFFLRNPFKGRFGSEFGSPINIMK